MRILIIDPRFQVYQGGSALLDGCYHNSVVRQAVNACEALHFLEELLPEIILVDARMPDIHGLKAIRLIKAEFQSFLILVLSLDQGLKNKAISAGADAFVSKSDPPERLLEAFDLVLCQVGLKRGHWVRMSKEKTARASS
jgi:DNA-binding NarL/FixJ family response regulator